MYLCFVLKFQAFSLRLFCPSLLSYILKNSSIINCWMFFLIIIVLVSIPVYHFIGSNSSLPNSSNPFPLHISSHFPKIAMGSFPLSEKCGVEGLLKNKIETSSTSNWWLVLYWNLLLTLPSLTILWIFVLQIIKFQYICFQLILGKRSSLFHFHKFCPIL